MAKRARTIDEYLTGLDAESRAALQKVRRAIHAAVPNAEECISLWDARFPSERKADRWIPRDSEALLVTR